MSGYSQLPQKAAPEKTTLMAELADYFVPPENFQHRYRQFLDQYYIVYNLFLLLLSVIALVISVISTVLWLSQSEIGLTIARGLNVFNILISILSVWVLLAICNLDLSLFRFCKLHNAPVGRFLRHKSGTFPTWSSLLWQILWHCVFPYPFIEQYSHVLSVFVIARMYRIPTVIRLMSYMYRVRNRIDVYMRFYSKDLPEYNNGLIIKVLLNMNGFKVFGVFCVALYVVLCYFAYAAMKYSSLTYPMESSSDFSLATSLYWALQTTTTLGYGEIALNHQDWFVLLIAMLVAFVGLANNSLLTGIFAMELSPQGSEELAFEMSEGLKQLQELKKESQKLLQIEYVRKCAELTGDTSVNTERLAEKQQKIMDRIYQIRWRLNDVFQNFRNANISKEIKKTLDDWEKRSAEYRGDPGIKGQGVIREMCQLYTRVLRLCHILGANITSDNFV